MDYEIMFRSVSDNEKDYYIKEMEAIVEGLKNKIVPEKYPETLPCINMSIQTLLSGKRHLQREYMLFLSSYCTISRSWLKELKPILTDKKCLEVMCGAGMLSQGLREEGIDVIATDSKEWHFPPESYWCKVEQLDAVSAIEKYGKDINYIICSWIPHKSEVGTQILLKMREVNPALKMIYIGELGGCCADDSFVKTCKFENDEIIDRANSKLISWPGIREAIYLLS